MLEVRGEDPESGYQVDGFVGAPSLTRANRTYMTFFVNRRWVQSRMLSFAVEEAYMGLLPVKRYPLSALNISISPWSAKPWRPAWSLPAWSPTRRCGLPSRSTCGRFVSDTLGRTRHTTTSTTEGRRPSETRSNGARVG